MTTTTVATRPMTSADAAEVAQLCAELGYQSTDLEIAERIAAMVTHPDHEVLVAETSDGNIVGWIHVFAARRLESGGFAEIGGLIVASRHRRRGVGARLVAAAEQMARSFEFSTVRVRCRVERGGAHAFYEDLEFLPVKTQRVYERLVAEKKTTNAKE